MMKKGMASLIVVSGLLVLVLLLPGCSGCETTPSAPSTTTPTPSPTPTPLPPGPKVLLSPSDQQVAVGSTVTISVNVEDVSQLYGAEIHLAFDASKLEVIDLDPQREDIQVKPGSLLNPERGFVAVNQADNAKGTLDYAITLLSPASPVDGGGVIIEEIRFKCLSRGTSSVRFTGVKLSSSEAVSLPFSAQDGTITVK